MEYSSLNIHAISSGLLHARVCVCLCVRERFKPHKRCFYVCVCVCDTQDYALPFVLRRLPSGDKTRLLRGWTADFSPPPFNQSLLTQNEQNNARVYDVRARVAIRSTIRKQVCWWRANRCWVEARLHVHSFMFSYFSSFLLHHFNNADSVFPLFNTTLLPPNTLLVSTCECWQLHLSLSKTLLENKCKFLFLYVSLSQ